MILLLLLLLILIDCLAWTGLLLYRISNDTIYKYGTGQNGVSKKQSLILIYTHIDGISFGIF